MTGVIMLRLAVARRLEFPSFEHPVVPADADSIEIDMRPTNWVDPYGLVGLMCWVARLRAEERMLRLLRPDNDDVAMYLGRMNVGGLLEQCGATLDLSLPPHRANDHQGFLLEVQQFRDVTAAERMANLIFERVQERVHPGVRGPLHENVSELALNAEEHAASRVGGFMAAQTYRRHHAGERLIFALGDAGIGIRSHLQGTHPVKTDEAAIVLALQRGVTATGMPGRGVGLADFVDFVNQHGAAVIHSGACRFRIGDGPRAARNFQGTLIGADIRCRP